LFSILPPGHLIFSTSDVPLGDRPTSKGDEGIIFKAVLGGKHNCPFFNPSVPFAPTLELAVGKGLFVFDFFSRRSTPITEERNILLVCLYHLPFAPFIFNLHFLLTPAKSRIFDHGPEVMGAEHCTETFRVSVSAVMNTNEYLKNT